MRSKAILLTLVFVISFILIMGIFQGDTALASENDRTAHKIYPYPYPYPYPLNFLPIIFGGHFPSTPTETSASVPDPHP